MIKLLIVCGGSGISFLGQRNPRDFDGVIQLDVINNTPRSLIDDNCHLANLPALEDTAPEMSLLGGLSRTPSIGNQKTQHLTIEDQLNNTLEKFIQNDDYLEVWLISSISGGTGEGIHRRIIDLIARYVKDYCPNLNVIVNSIRVNSQTCRQIDTKRSNLNMFIGLVADAVLHNRFKEEYGSENDISISLRQYYLSNVDISADSNFDDHRGQMIQCARNHDVNWWDQSGLIKPTDMCYRVFPKLQDSLMRQLGLADSTCTFVNTELGAIYRIVLAIEGYNTDCQKEAVETHRNLLHSLWTIWFDQQDRLG